MVANAFGVEVTKSFGPRQMHTLRRIGDRADSVGLRAVKLMAANDRGPQGIASARATQSQQQLFEAARRGRVPRAARQHGFTPTGMSRAIYLKSLRNGSQVRGVGGTEVAKILALTAYPPHLRKASVNPFVRDDLTRAKALAKKAPAALRGAKTLDRKTAARGLKRGGLVALKLLEDHIP